MGPGIVGWSHTKAISGVQSCGLGFFYGDSTQKVEQNNTQEPSKSSENTGKTPSENRISKKQGNQIAVQKPFVQKRCQFHAYTPHPLPPHPFPTPCPFFFSRKLATFHDPTEYGRKKAPKFFNLNFSC